MSRWAYAFRLSKSEVALSEPPGTLRLYDLGDLHSAHPEDNIHLNPQPSSSPADPLNWPAWRKYAILAIMSLYAAVTNFNAAVVGPALPIMQYEVQPVQPFAKLNYLVAVNVLLIGTSNLIWVPVANTVGRRPVLIFAMLATTAFSVWCGVARSFGSLLAARALQGFSTGPADAIAPNVLGEVFFVHERGRAMAIYSVFLAGGGFVGGVSGSYIANHLGYKYIFWLSTVLIGFVSMLEILLVPETSFSRGRGNQAQNPSVQHPRPPIEDDKPSTQAIEVHQNSEMSSGDFTYLSSLKVGLVGDYRDSIWQHALRPWLSLAFPGTWIVMLHYGGLLGGLITISTIGPQFLAAPPYLWREHVGLLSLGGLVGCLLGSVATFFTADRLLSRWAKRTGRGLAEPESRLPAMFFALLLATTGIWTFGFSAADPSQRGWVGMIVGYGMLGFGITQVPSIGFNYIIDSYPGISSDCFVMTTVARAVISFAWTFFIGEWIAHDGAALPFGIFGMMMGVFSLLTIPLWLFGKRMRIATARYLPKSSLE